MVINKMHEIMLRRYDNAVNTNKTQLLARDCYSADKRLPRKFQHPKDVLAQVTQTMDKKRVTWKAEAESNSPPNRVYACISDTGSGAETGETYRPSLSVITRKSKRGLWRYGTATE